MKTIEIDEELYQYIASNTRAIGESASDILRRLLNLSPEVTVLKETKLSTQSKKTHYRQPEMIAAQITNRLRALMKTEKFLQQTKTVSRFLTILTLLYRLNPEGFAQATEMLQGRTRVYFDRDKNILLAAGNHTKPKQIPETPYWVITNTNTARKMLMLENIMLSMNLSKELIDDVRAFFVVN